jgi:hypothetical protein
MSLPYESASSGRKALDDMDKTLRAFGCTKFGNMMDMETGILMVQFEYRGRPVQVKASIAGYAAAWLQHHPWSRRMHCTRVEHERKAKAIAGVAIYSMLRDWIKGQTTAVETGILSFEGAFLGQLLLPNGMTVFETVQAQNLLPALPNENVVQLERKP